MIANFSSGRLRWQTIRKIGRQQSRDTLFGWGIYVTAAVSVGIAAILIFNSIRFVGESNLNIISQPLLVPVQVILTIAMLFVAVEATLSIARPRDQGALQVLFFAPIDESIVLGGNLLSGILIYLFFVVLTLPILLLIVWVANFVAPIVLLWAVIPTILATGVALAFGLFISSAAPTARGAVLILVAVILVLLGLQSAYTALQSIPPTNRFFDALQFMRTILASLQVILSWISPFRMLDIMLVSALNQDWLELLRQMAISLGMIIVWFVAAVRMLQRRGVVV